MSASTASVIAARETASPLKSAFIAAGVFALALSATPVAASGDGDAERGETAYEANCASCHANAARILTRVEGEDDEARTETLQAFLPDHYAEDDQERADIIAYMLSL